MKNSTGNHHILFLVPLPPPVHGSAVMSRQILDSRVIRSSFDCDFVNISTSRTMGEVSHFTIKKPLRHLIIFLKILIKLLFHKYDACYIALTCYGKGFLKDAPFALLCKTFRKKLIIHQHNKGMSSCIERYPYKYLIPLVYKNSSVILLSWRLFTDIESVVSRDQVCICPNGVPWASFPVKKNRNGIPHILFLSNLLKSKGVIELLDACAVMKSRGVLFICDVVGKETAEILREVLESEIKARCLEESVIYHGAKYGEDKDVFLSLSNVFVLPSLDECFPLVLLEAMQHGIPVVATEEGGIPDIVEDGKTGFIVPKHDVSALADKVEYLINNPDLSYSMGQTGFKKYREEFQLEMWENRLCNILKSLCN